MERNPSNPPWPTDQPGESRRASSPGRLPALSGHTISSRTGSQRTMRRCCWDTKDMRKVAVSTKASLVEHLGVPRLRMQFTQSTM